MNKAVLELVRTSSDLRGGRLEATKALLGTTVKLIAPAKQVLFNLKFTCIMNRSRGHELDLFSEDMRLVFDKHSHWNFVAFFFCAGSWGFRESSYDLEQGAI